MPQSFYARLKQYYIKIGAVLRGEADAASIFPNTTDVGISRENVYVEFLKMHLPSSCNVSLGGFLFNLEGKESNQIDVIVTNDVAPQFNFHNRDGSGKTFACIEGCVAVASIKSNLNSGELRDSLQNLASIPDKKSLDGRVVFLLNVPDYDEWPFKVIYASNGVSIDTALKTVTEFYDSNPHIPYWKRPNIIHVAGKYNIVRVGKEGGKMRDGTELPAHAFIAQSDSTDVYALSYATVHIQQNAVMV
jgi:hypothetical protein